MSQQQIETTILSYLHANRDIPPTLNALSVHCYRACGASCPVVYEAIRAMAGLVWMIDWRQDCRVHLTRAGLQRARQAANPAPSRAQTAAPLSEGRPGAYTSPALALLMVARDVCFEAAAGAARRSAA